MGIQFKASISASTPGGVGERAGGGLRSGVTLPADLRTEASQSRNRITLQSIAGMSAKDKQSLERLQRALVRQDSLPFGAEHLVSITGAPGTEKTTIAFAFANGIEGAQVIDPVRDEAEIRRTMGIPAHDAITLQQILRYAKNMSLKNNGLMAVVLDQIERYSTDTAAATREFDEIRENKRSKVVVIATTDDLKGVAPRILSRFQRKIMTDLPNREETLDLLGFAITDTIAQAGDSPIFTPELTAAAKTYEQAISAYNQAQRDSIVDEEEAANMGELLTQAQTASEALKTMLVNNHVDVLKEAQGLTHREIYDAMHSLRGETSYVVDEHIAKQGEDSELDATHLVDPNKIASALSMQYRSYPAWLSQQRDRRESAA